MLEDRGGARGGAGRETPALKRILCTVGTRPEAIKMAPVIRALRAEPWATTRVLATGQHRALLDEALAPFGIAADADLAVMRPDQSLGALTARLFAGLDAALEAERPDLVIAQGDTSSTLVAALASFYRRVPFAHVEAGLRTGDLANPFPEELNRVVAGKVAALHLAPTETARDNLLREGVPAAAIRVTGNTVVDALRQIAAASPAPAAAPGRRTLLLTLHRRESLGAPLRGMLQAIRAVLDRFPDLELIYPVHPGPAVLAAAEAVLGGHPRIRLSPPLPYGRFLAVMAASHLVLTDSGGVQEEAPVLGRPVLVLRSATERPEGVALGVARLVGTEPAGIVAALSALLADPGRHAAMARPVSPYGDGRAAERIVAALAELMAPPAGRR